MSSVALDGRGHNESIQEGYSAAHAPFSYLELRATETIL